MRMRQELQTTSETGSLQRETMAWLACLTNAVPLSIVLIALLTWLSEMPVANWFALGVYVCVFTSLVSALKPWSVR